MLGGSTNPSHPFGRVERVFVLGIDPGLSRCGYGAISRTAAGAQLVTRAYGVIRTDPAAELPARLALLAADLNALLDDLRPDVVVVERVFFQTNVRTAMAVGQASGLALAAASARGCHVVQYTSNEVKQSVAGYGAATKEQVQRMVATLLGLAERPSPPDAADALALALCHHACAPLAARVESAGGSR